MKQREQIQVKLFEEPEETRRFENGRVDIVDIGNGVVVGLGHFDPGWKWSEHIKPTAGTESCQVRHVGYVLTGRMHIRMDDGSEMEIGAGHAVHIPPGHDAWVVSDETCRMLDFTGMGTYALPRTRKSVATRKRSPQPAGPSSKRSGTKRRRSKTR